MIKRPQKLKPNAEMNVVPYIDVMLVLLVIFMVTAPMITTGVKVDLPQANSNPIQSEDKPSVVSLKADGTITLSDKVYEDKVMSLEELESVLTENQKQAETDKKQLTILINGSESRPYGEVMKLMSALQDSGLTQVGLLTEPLK